jgi:NAD(P)-dependent dehydrogenase (short-subunit alcohol dehydrogenase family)
MTNSHFPFIANEFKGKRVLVTRETQGIGEAIVYRLNEGGAKVVTTARSIPSQMRSSDAIFIQACHTGVYRNRSGQMPYQMLG